MNTYSLVLLAALFAYSSALSCYQCVSTVNENCDGSEINLLTPYKKKCDPLPDGTYKSKPAIGCRKIIQKVEEDPITIIRECAYTGEPVSGLKKSGNWAVSKTYYQCNNDKDDEPCNGSPSKLFFSTLAILAAVFFL